MKKLLAILASALLCVAVVAGCSGGGGGSDKAEWTAMKTLNDLKIEDIQQIDFRVGNPDGVFTGTIPGSDIEALQQICGMLEEIDFDDAAEEGATGAPLEIKITTSEGVLEFNFEGDILVLSEDQRFNAENVQELRDYLSNIIFRG